MPKRASPPIHDLVIIGAGPAGGTLALVCARLGLDVALVDAHDPDTPRPRDTRNFAIVRGSWNLFSHAGLTGALLPDAEPLNGLEAVDGARHWFGLPGALFSASDLGEGDEPLGYMVEAERLQSALDEEIAREEAITLFAPALFDGAEAGPAAIEVRLAGGETLRARLLVGSDGVNSQVREAAGIGTEERSYGKSVFAADVTLSRPHDGIARQLFTPEGPFATLPLRGDRANLAWYMKEGAAETLAALSVAEIEAELNDRFAGFAGEMKLDGPHTAYPLRMKLARAMVAERIALVGDAARRINPLAGQGLNLGLKDVAALAEVVSDEVRAGLDPGSASALERYSRWRHFDSTATALAMDAIDRVFSNDNLVLKPLRSLALTLADKTPLLRTTLARQASAAQSYLPRLMRVRG